MDINQELERLQKEKSELERSVAVSEAKVKELASTLGISPTAEAVEAKRKELQLEMQKNNEEIEKLMKEYEALSQEEVSSESPSTETSTHEANSVQEDFE